jgi:hypothetical protein
MLHEKINPTLQEGLGSATPAIRFLERFNAQDLIDGVIDEIAYWQGQAYRKDERIRELSREARTNAETALGDMFRLITTPGIAEAIANNNIAGDIANADDILIDPYDDDEDVSDGYDLRDYPFPPMTDEIE